MEPIWLFNFHVRHVSPHAHSEMEIDTMAKILTLKDSLRTEYDRLFAECVVRPIHMDAINNSVQRIIGGKSRYQAVAQATGVPWTVIAAIHLLECNLSFTRHLHNGDPLSAKTSHIPKGRPPGTAPWSWEESAVDALREFAQWNDWSVAGTLYKLESYNGFGYRLYHPTVLSPYLWSYSNHYTKGKYAADGVWSASLVSRQPGAAVILRRLAAWARTLLQTHR